MTNADNSSSSRFTIFGLVVIVIAALAVGYFHFSRNREVAAIRDARAAVAERGPRIEVVPTAAGPSERVIKLLGDVRPILTTTIYGKVAGYIKRVAVDKGDRITAGQVLAEIDSSELDQQYAGASADLANKQRNLNRARELFSRGNTTEVAKLQAETDAGVAENTVAALGTMKGYQVIRAPYAGHVTARFVDTGAFITPGATTFASATPIMTVSDDTRVKVYLYLEQADVPFVHVGDAVEVSGADDPSRTRSATLTRMNGELDIKTHTMLAEVNVDNSDGFFVAGGSAYVTLHVQTKSYPQIPVTALLTRGDQNVVAALDHDILRFKRVQVASTDGSTLNLSDGLQPGDVVAINVPDEVTDGSRIQPVPVTAPIQGASKAD